MGSRDVQRREVERALNDLTRGRAVVLEATDRPSDLRLLLWHATTTPPPGVGDDVVWAGPVHAGVWSSAPPEARDRALRAVTRLSCSLSPLLVGLPSAATVRLAGPGPTTAADPQPDVDDRCPPSRLDLDALEAYLAEASPEVRRVARTVMPTAVGRFTAHGYALRGHADAVVLSRGLDHDALGEGRAPTPVSVHLACGVGDLLATTGCGCRAALDASLARVASEDHGVVVYLLAPHQAHGCPTLRGALESDHPVPVGLVVAMLRDLGLRRVRFEHAPEGIAPAARHAGLMVAAHATEACAPVLRAAAGA